MTVRSMALTALVGTLLLPTLSAAHLVHKRKLLSVREAAKGLYADRKVCVDRDSGNVQCYPDLMFVGESKAGTTSISSYLWQHPHVAMQSWNPLLQFFKPDAEFHQNKPLPLEPHIFDQHILPNSIMESMNWITAPTASKEKMGDFLQMHYTPNYIYCPDAPFQILDVYPNARSIKYFVMLRNPTERAISAWKFHAEPPVLGMPKDKRTFKEVVDEGISQRLALEACYAAELTVESQILSFAAKRSPPPSFVEDLPIPRQRHIINKCFWNERGTHDSSNPLVMMRLMHSHVDKGIYIDAVRRWSALLGGLAQLHIFSLEGWVADPHGSFTNITRHAGLEAVGANGFSSEQQLDRVLNSQWNEGSPSSKHLTTTNDEDIARLKTFYEPYTADLFKFLGQRLW
mmetsp:Transcript_60984/g.131166  ORF Transcript_60984/g.131166 Transcript_60984/m.131166 type:complete len:401 (-) Transcript_60984:51-1253(-)